MNISEFAERIVFGTTLEEKLQPPGKLTYNAQPAKSLNLDSLRNPSRPVGMEMQLDANSAVAPPGDGKLENEYARGQLLHFLANHELLATELMALVLLKFPDAPRAFRQGVLVTLQEEQEHTRIYMRRMKECGVEFGSHPLSGQFWRIVEPMNSPLDFVSRLSLTFEQANLDYSLHFAKVFRRIGDEETSAVLQQIYEDEIGHVQHGLNWFRQWKNEQQSDWEAYQASLEFPMSPQRGRAPGIQFNREGRKRAGMSDAFIDAMEVFRQSRGRAASLRWFDPGVESELHGHAKPSERQLIDQLTRDLEMLMIAVCKPDDILLVDKTPSLELRKRLIKSGFELPEFALKSERNELTNRKLHDFSPWAWSPANHQLVEGLTPFVRHSPPDWNPSLAELYRKSWSTATLQNWLGDEPRPRSQTDSNNVASNENLDWLPSIDCIGNVLRFSESGVSDVDVESQIQSALKTFAQRGFDSAILKQDLATSGRGQRRLRCDQPLTQADRDWLAHCLANGSTSNRPGTVVGVIEPELDRRADLSFLWHLPQRANDQASVQFLGWTRPVVTAGRRYAGTRLTNPFANESPEMKRFLLSDRGATINSVATWLEQRIVPELLSRGFEGYFGIDAFVFQDGDGKLKIKPMVELNPRMTMGHLALGLTRRLAPGVDAEFQILTRSEWDNERTSLESTPLTTANGQLKSAAIVFAEVNESSKLVPVLRVGHERRS